MTTGCREQIFPQILKPNTFAPNTLKHVFKTGKQPESCSQKPNFKTQLFHFFWKWNVTIRNRSSGLCCSYQCLHIHKLCQISQNKSQKFQRESDVAKSRIGRSYQSQAVNHNHNISVENVQLTFNRSFFISSNM